MRALFLAPILLFPLSACASEEEPVANKWERQAAEIENKAAAIEAEVDNEVRALEARLDNEVDALLHNGAAANAVEAGGTANGSEAAE